MKDHATVQRASLLMMKSVDVMTRLNVSLARVHHVHALVRTFLTSKLLYNLFSKATGLSGLHVMVSAVVVFEHANATIHAFLTLFPSSKLKSVFQSVSRLSLKLFAV